MRQIDKEEALHAIRQRQGAGDHVDKRLVNAVNVAQTLYLLTLEDETSFLSLIWQEISATRLLTPGASRTLRDVVQRMIDDSLTFESLSSDLGLPKGYHNPKWFRNCLDIDAAFDLAHFGWVAVVPAVDSERRQSPSGSFYVYDGVHKSLVLAKRLLFKEVAFHPIEALLILPRPND